MYVGCPGGTWGCSIVRTTHKQARSMTEIINHLLGKTKPKLKEGRWKAFNRHAVLIAEGCYVHNLKHGPWREYYDTGELMLEECYENGLPHGRYASYHPCGALVSEGVYVQGRREGYFKIYDKAGKHIKSLLFINNDLINEVHVHSHEKAEGRDGS